MHKSPCTAAINIDAPCSWGCNLKPLWGFKVILPLACCVLQCRTRSFSGSLLCQCLIEAWGAKRHRWGSAFGCTPEARALLFLSRLVMATPLLPFAPQSTGLERPGMWHPTHLALGAGRHAAGCYNVCGLVMD